ncbi:hypothetical protein Tco_1084239, partial [Tanacetum coccineum]
VKEVTDLDQPRTLKYIQSINGKLAALSRFLSKGAERSLAFFKILKGCKDKKSIQWTTEAEKALKRMKKLIQGLPTLTAPRVLQGAELNYPALEKLVLALVHAARSLRRYFQASTITFSQTRRNAKLTRPVKTGREPMAIKLGEHDIVFLRREEKETSADFLVEIPSEDNE